MLVGRGGAPLDVYTSRKASRCDPLSFVLLAGALVFGVALQQMRKKGNAECVVMLSLLLLWFFLGIALPRDVKRSPRGRNRRGNLSAKESRARVRARGGWPGRCYLPLPLKRGERERERQRERARERESETERQREKTCSLGTDLLRPNAVQASKQEREREREGTSQSV